MSAESNDRLHVTHAVLSLDVGGLERIVVDLVREGRRRGQRVSVLCLERPGTLAPRAEEEGATLVCLGKPPGVRLGTPARVGDALRALRPDVLHTHQVGALFYAGRAARAAGVGAVVHTEHINNFRKAAGGRVARARMGWLWWLAARSADRFFCVSEDIVEEMARRRLAPRRKLGVVLNGIDTARFADPGDPDLLRRELGLDPAAPVVGTVGRLNEVKSQDLLLRAFARVYRQAPDARLLLVGDGPMRGPLEALAGRLGVANAVRFAGYQADPARFLHVMDVFALTSRMEGMPLAILEAWAAGRPVLASAVGGVPDMIRPGDNGLLFPSGDEDALAAALGRLLADRDEARRLGEAGRSEATTRYDLRRMAADYEAHYEELLARRGRGVACAS